MMTGRAAIAGVGGGADQADLHGGRLDGVRVVRTDLPMLCEKSLTAVFLRDSDPAAGLAGDLTLGRLHGAPRAGRLSRRAVVLLELAQGPPKRRPLPASTADTTRRNTGIVERLLSLLPTLRAAPSHPTDSTDRDELRPFRPALDYSSGPEGLRVCRLIDAQAPPTGARSTVQPTTKRQSIEMSAKKWRHRSAIRSTNTVRVYASCARS